MTVTIHGAMSRRALAIAGIGAVFGHRAILAQPAATPASPVPSNAALYRIDLPASSLPDAPIVVGVAAVTMASGTVIAYPEGSAGPSLAIDHVLAGGYDIETDSELLHIDAAGEVTDIEAGQTTGVDDGETMVLLHNEAAQRITAGSEETRTFTVGLFSLEQGTNESSVEGTLDQQLLGGVVLDSMPEPGVTVMVVRAAEAGSLTGAVAELPVTLGSDDWVVFVLPLATD